MNRFKTALIFIILFSINSVLAAEEEEIRVDNLNYCYVSKVAINNYEPEVFETTNNLLRKSVFTNIK